MKLWKLTIDIETDDYTTKGDILSIVNRDLNRGDGLYAILDKAKVKLIKNIPEDDE